METTFRRYDIDWLRVIAIGFLLIYHVAICFQPWGGLIGFITTQKPWVSLWMPMALLNVWRIPLLFFVSGMGVYFALRKRNWFDLLKERAARILLPFAFGVFAIVPVHILIWQYHFKIGLSYSYGPGHLWFLANIFIYVVLLSPLFIFLKKQENGKFVSGLKKVLSHPLGLIPVLILFLIEVLLLQPRPFELYAMTWHGFFLGFLAFFAGFCFVLGGKPFWEMTLKWRWLFLGIALLLFVIRINWLGQNPSNVLVSIESNNWIFAIFGFGYKYLNRPGKILRYLSQAAYPVYIVHMIFLYLGGWLIFPLNLPVPIQFFLTLLFTLGGCLAFYELVLRRITMIRPLFGLKWK